MVNVSHSEPDTTESHSCFPTLPVRWIGFTLLWNEENKQFQPRGDTVRWICLEGESRLLVFLIGLMNLFRLCLRGKENTTLSQPGKKAFLSCDPQRRNISLKSTRRVGCCGRQPYSSTESCPVLHRCLTVSSHFPSLRFGFLPSYSMRLGRSL